MKKKLPELTTKPATGELQALVDGMEVFNADLTQFVGRDKNNKLQVVAVAARGSYAALLLRFLKRLEEKENAESAKATAAAPKEAEATVPKKNADRT